MWGQCVPFWACWGPPGQCWGGWAGWALGGWGAECWRLNLPLGSADLILSTVDGRFMVGVNEPPSRARKNHTHARWAAVGAGLAGLWLGWGLGLGPLGWGLGLGCHLGWAGLPT